MTRKLFLLLFSTLLLAIGLTACLPAPVTLPADATQPAWTPIPIPTVVAAAEATPTEPPTISGPTAITPHAPAATGQANTAPTTNDPAAAAVQRYFASLEAGDFETAAGYFSSYSLMVAGTTRGEVALALQGEMARGSKWSALEVKDSRSFGSHTILVHVVYHLAGKDAKTGKDTDTTLDETWPVRLENGKWLYNRGNLIDFLSLTTAEQSMGGLRVKPRQLTRYSDHLALTLMVQNQTNEPIVLGQVNEIMAAFTFGDRRVEAEKKQLIFDHLRTYPSVDIIARGLFDTYPDGVIIRQWKNLKVAPWFTFHFGD